MQLNFKLALIDITLYKERSALLISLCLIRPCQQSATFVAHEMTIQQASNLKPLSFEKNFGFRPNNKNITLTFNTFIN